MTEIYDKKAYNKTTLIQGQKVILSDTESKKVDDFHKSRVAFAILKDGRCAINVKDCREHRVYLQEDFGISFEEFEGLIRGYIKSGRITFYQSSKFLPVENLSDNMLEMVYQQAVKFFGSGKYEIWNGLKVADIGEEWKPLKIVKSVYLD